MRLLHRDRHDHAVDTAGDDDRTDDRTAVATVPTPAHEAVRAERDPFGGVATDHTTPVKVRERTWAFAPGQLVSLVAGGALVAVGVVALVRAGTGRPLDTPVVQVLGWNHTAWLGLGEIGLGALLMLVGTGPWGRWLSVLLGASTVVAGVIVLAEPAGLPDELALEQDFGWPLVVLGAIVAVAAMALPVWRSSHTNVRTVDLRDDDHGAVQDDDEARRHFWSRR